MATRKKPTTTKEAAASKKTATKSPRRSTKKASTSKTSTKTAHAKTSTTTKRPATRKTTHKRTASEDIQSFKAAKNPESFMTFRISRQTIYWIIIGVCVIALATWIARLQYEINEIYDQIDSSNAAMRELNQKEVEIYKNRTAKEK